MRRLLAVALLLTAGCGGLRPGDGAVLWDETRSWEDPRTGRTEVEDFVVVIPRLADALATEDSSLPAGRRVAIFAGALAVTSGTPILLVRDEDGWWLVKVRAGAHDGATGWVRAKHLRRE